MKNIFKIAFLLVVCVISLWFLWRHWLSENKGKNYDACVKSLRLGMDEKEITRIMGNPDKQGQTFINCSDLSKSICKKGQNQVTVKTLYYYNPAIMADHNVVYLDTSTMKSVLISCSDYVVGG